MSRSFELDVPQFQQIEDGYCLPACVQMVLAHWGIDRSQRKIAKQIKTIPRAGTPGSRLRFLASRRLAVAYERGDFDDLVAALERGIPPIVLVQTKELPYWDESTAHAIVITGVDDTHFIVNDPIGTEPSINVSHGDLLLAWDEMYNYFGLVWRLKGRG